MLVLIENANSLLYRLVGWLLIFSVLFHLSVLRSVNGHGVFLRLGIHFVELKYQFSLLV